MQEAQPQKPPPQSTDSSWWLLRGGRPKFSIGDSALTALSSWDSTPLRPVSVAFNATDGCMAEGHDSYIKKREDTVVLQGASHKRWQLGY
uniref:Uncharacterized protein n=1 Tax=Leersia perrieri TaxID=77586 RepID=A0A0D9VLI1_9ORYZ